MVYKSKIGKQEYAYESVRDPVTKQPKRKYLGNVKNQPVVVDSTADIDSELESYELQEQWDGFIKILKDPGTNLALAKIAMVSTNCYLQKVCEVLVSNAMTDKVEIIHGFIKYLSSLGIYPDVVESLRHLENRRRNTKVDLIPEMVPEIKIKNAD